MATAASQSADLAGRVVGEDVTTTNTSAPERDSQVQAPSSDPFASQRTPDNNPFTERRGSSSVNPAMDASLSSSPPAGSSPVRDRKMSKEWDASKVPPSRFQKREGSLYATPSSRDGLVERNKQHAYSEKLKEKGWS